MSVLELFHPTGVSARSLVLGSGLAPTLCPPSRVTNRESSDVVILAPTARECRTAGWLQEAVDSTRRTLEPNGIVYVLAPRRWRVKIAKRLSEYGLSIDQSIAHLPDQETSRYLIPLNSIAAHYAFEKLLPLPRWGRLLASLAFRHLGRERLWRLLPSVGLIMRRPDTRSICEWLFNLHPQHHEGGRVIIRTSWRGEGGAVVLFCFFDGETSPSAVAKMHLTPMGNVMAEAEVIEKLVPSARKAGAQVPARLLQGQLGGHPVFLQTMIEGQPVVSVLRTQPRRLFDVMERLVSWLETWNRDTTVQRPLDHQRLKTELFESAALLGPVLKQGDEYRKSIEREFLPLAGTGMPLVATHNDLTMWNLLLDDQGRLGVVDWESACAKGFPFVDFFYAVTDAITVARCHGDRLRAFQECFTVHGLYRQMVEQHLARLRRDSHTPDEIVSLCFHACWLHHAANEHRSAGPADSRPFLQLVRWLALHRADLGRWVT